MFKHVLTWVGVGGAVLLGVSGASAHQEIPGIGFTLGPSVAYASSSGLGGAWVDGIDGSISWKIVWASAGVRRNHNPVDSRNDTLVYGEAGAWYLVNVGLGYTHDATNGSTNLSGAHFFVGAPVPVPIDVFGDSGVMPYVEPYYRPLLGRDTFVHEAGVLVKVGWWSDWGK